MPRYGNDLALRAHETGYGPVVTSERYDTVEMRLAFQGRQARRDHGPDLEAVGGGEPPRTPRYVVPTLNAGLFWKQEVLSVDRVFANFHPKFEMPIYTKVVSFDKMDNFHKGRF
jgi:hypothetical protein